MKVRRVSEAGPEESAPMELQPFDPAAAATVSGWAASPDEVSAWSAADFTQVPPEVIASWSEADEVTAFAVTDEDTLVAYGELWTDDDEEEVELARLIVAPEHRGHGVGRWLVDELTARARTTHPDIYLRVRPENAAARRCYVNAGYTRVTAEEEAAWNVSQPTPNVWMQAPSSQ